ncbi:EscU/YscU/HrcU family type III secretion system export apparatus switch protein [Pleionea litopenaei]|uniref:Flagellar biosynthetic protein FlhB n=1 Tax=Pleionea litopenaei TaxID=3070815 RepID=A0AA51RVA9_9GAMM|nr:EscU/YscU/HrcU family type III secretion system export apparatus switch protein [Pleionea sp. HL-JVS1]WMS88159.1 EscU/YscU/HrcU family type III secretion system export apparatus switch protein [Pleionea sp. HL-JVS1]
MKNKSLVTHSRPTKTKRAAALKYDGKQAPKITAKGSGATAENILAIAAEHNVFIHEDPLLIEVLAQLELGEEIPEQLYLAVAQIIAFAYLLQDKTPDDL